MNINYPNITDLSDKGKIEIKNYLFSLVNQLNYSFTETEKNTKDGEKKIEMVEKKYDDIDNSLKTIISLIKSLKSNGGETDNGSYEEGVADGKQTAYDEFWDKFQANGNRVNYQCGFNGIGWTDETFKPKYNIIPQWATSNAYGLFQYSSIKNLKKCLEDCGVVWDMSNMGYLSDLFSYSTIEVAPILNFSTAYNIGKGVRHAPNLKSIDKIILPTRDTNFGTKFFEGCFALEHCPFEGIIKNTGFNVQDCVLLDKESITSIINCLATDTSGLTVTFSKQAVNKAFETSVGLNDGSNSTEWKALADTKKNWTISLT